MSPQPCSANGRYYIAQPVARPTACHSEPPRMRRVEESTSISAKWLQCNHAYAPSLLSFRPKRGVKRRAERRNLSHCTYAFAMSICPCSIPSPYCNPCKILRLRASLFARHSAQDDRVGGVAPRPCSGNVPLHQVPRTSFITLHNIIPRTAGV